MPLAPVQTPVERALLKRARDALARRSLLPGPGPGPGITPPPPVLTPLEARAGRQLQRPTPSFTGEYPGPSPVPRPVPSPVPPGGPKQPFQPFNPPSPVWPAIGQIARGTGETLHRFLKRVAASFVPQGWEKRLGLEPKELEPPKTIPQAIGRGLPALLGILERDFTAEELAAEPFYQQALTAIPAGAWVGPEFRAAGALAKEAFPQAQLAAKAIGREVVTTPAVRQPVLKAAMPLRMAEKGLSMEPALPLPLKELDPEYIGRMRGRYFEAKTTATKRKIEREFIEAHGLESVPIGSKWGLATPRATKAAPQEQIDFILARLRMEAPPLPPAQEAEYLARVAKPVAPVAAAAKEPWQMTQKAYQQQELNILTRKGLAFDQTNINTLARGHEKFVRQAHLEGKAVPPEVLADYPDLAARVAPRAEVPPAAKPATGVAIPISHNVQFQDGILYYTHATPGEARDIARAYVFRKAHEGQTIFYRATNNVNEHKLPIPRSRNYLTGQLEKGLSVSESPGYLLDPYKYIGVVKGDIIGYGSDGEPLLSNVEWLAKPTTYEKLPAKYKYEAIEKPTPFSYADIDSARTVYGEPPSVAAQPPSPIALHQIRARSIQDAERLGLAGDDLQAHVTRLVEKEFGMDPELTLYRGVPAEGRAPQILSAEELEALPGRWWTTLLARAQSYTRGKGQVYEAKFKASELANPELAARAETAENAFVLTTLLQRRATARLAPPEAVLPVPRAAEPPSPAAAKAAPPIEQVAPPPVAKAPPVGPPGVPPKPPPPVTAGVPPEIPGQPTVPVGIQGDLRLAAEMVKQNQPGLPGKIADIIPGLRQIGRFFAPGKAMPENMRTAWVAKTGTASRLSTDFSPSRLPLLEKVDAVFGKGAAEGERVAVRFLGSGIEAKSPLTGTVLDIAQNPHLYELNAAQRAFLEQAQARNLANLDMVNTRYATDIGAFPVKPAGWHLPNVDKPDEALQAIGVTLEQAALRGRTKTRIWPTARERLAHTPTFKPDTNIKRLVWAQDESLAGAAAKQTFLAGLAGKTRLEVLQETHPQLAAKMVGLRKRLQSLRGSAGRLDENLDSAVQDFLTSPAEDVDLTTLRAGLDVKLKRGPRMGMDIAAIQKEIEGTKAQIKALQPAWKVANLKPYVFVQEGIYRYFPVEEARQLRPLLEVSRNPLLSFMENVRNFAFNFDLSPITGVQVPLGFFADPYGTGKQFGRWLVTSRKNPFSISAFTDEVAQNLKSWQEFAFVTGRPISAAVPAEFAGGWLKRIPGYQKVNESMFLLPTRMTKRMFDETVSSLEKAGFSHEQAIVAAGDQVTKAVPLWNPQLLGLSAAKEKLLRGVTISPSFLLRPPQLIAEAAQGYIKMGLFQTLTPKQRLAVRLMTGILGTIEGIAVMSNIYVAKQQGKDIDQALVDALTLHHPAFMALTLPNGDRINLGGPFRSFLRMIAPRTVPGSPVPIPFWGIGNWALSRVTPLARTELDLFRNKDFYGRRIIKGEFPENILRGLEYQIEGMAPLVGRPVPEALRTGQPLKEAAVETVTQVAGITYIPPRPIYELRRQWRGDFEIYNGLPTLAAEAKAKKVLTKQDYRKRNPEVDAKLFVAGEVESLVAPAAFPIAVRLMKENKLKISDIRGLEVQEFESSDRTALRRRFERALGLPISSRPVGISPVGPSYRAPQAPGKEISPFEGLRPQGGTAGGLPAWMQ